ncbi:hypothetical protein [uncultured Phycicoccus sp.]|uniref:hypothetical protein n=1 Tax=uncultured Phycicoccus sp. TaxID=661422 RepID=UPI00261265DE|nr:hypothetical protein [uncultured Phycicoccus sp.]
MSADQADTHQEGATPEEGDRTEQAESTGITPGADRQSPHTGAAESGYEDLPGPAHAVTQPLAPDGTPVPVDADGHLGAPTDEQMSREEP